MEINMGGKWSAEALENFRKLRKTWKSGPKPFSIKKRLKLGLDKGNWKQRHPEKHAEHRRAYSRRYPEKISAQNAVRYALKVGHASDGSPFSMGPCVICGFERKTEAHHASYAASKKYDVTWLCHSCHVKVSKENGQVKKQDFKMRSYLKK